MKSSSRLLTSSVKALIAVSVFILFAPSAAYAGHCRHHFRFHHSTNVKVMTRNLYLGADIFKVVIASMTQPDNPLAVPMAVSEVFQTVQYTNFPERAEALADEVLESYPHFIALQEVTTYYVQSPGDFVMGNPTQADTVVYDYLSLLLDALEARGLHYVPAVINTNADIEVPMLTGVTPEGYPVLDDLRMVDHDVILVRANIDFSNEMSAHYAYNVSMDLNGVNVEFTRGYEAIDAVVKGKVFRIVNTHLEVEDDPGTPFAMIQAAQMQELMTVLSYEDKPIILLGDLNSSPASADGQPYSQALAAGFTDTWLENWFHDEGYTCCFNETIDDPEAELYERIDHVFVMPNGLELRRVRSWNVGADAFDMTPGGLYPSDHAGVVAKLKFR